jgi:glycosyltransferase involved in cell wall biosynthesis
MNILLVNHYAGSLKYGMEFRPYLFAKEWIKAGHSVVIVGASYSHLRQAQPAVTGMVTRECLEGIEYRWIRTPAYSGNGVMRVVNIFAFLLRFLMNYSKVMAGFRPDIVIASSTYPLDNVSAHRIAIKFGAKHVYEVHDLWPLSLIELGGMSPHHPFVVLMRWAEHYAYRKSDFVVSMLPHAERHMRANGLHPNKFVYIPTGIDIGEDSESTCGIPELHECTIRMLRAHKKCLVGYVGGHALSNALESFVKAAAYVDSEKVGFVLVGGGAEKMHLQQLAQDAGLQNVYFLPPVPRKSVQALLDRMDILYLGWQKKSIYQFGICPNKLLDYMLSGKPIIHANAAANDIVAESRCGISVPPENPHAIGSVINNLIRMPEERKLEMGRKGKAYIIRQYQNCDLAMRYIAYLKGVLD